MLDKGSFGESNKILSSLAIFKQVQLPYVVFFIYWSLYTYLISDPCIKKQLWLYSLSTLRFGCSSTSLNPSHGVTAMTLAAALTDCFHLYKSYNKRYLYSFKKCHKLQYSLYDRSMPDIAVLCSKVFNYSFPLSCRQLSQEARV